MPDVVQPFALVFEIAGAGDAGTAAFSQKQRSKSGKGERLAFVFNGLIIQNLELQIRVIAPRDIFSGMNVAL